MRKLIFIISVVLMLVLGGCSSRQISLFLDDVESYIMERPDSALAVLESVDRELLTTDRLKAHHALLHAMALDKNFIDVDDDSLASVALSYYSRKGPDMYEARALYYSGLSYYYAGDYSKAILEFTKAEKVAEKSDSLYLGFVKVAQADTYNITYNEIEEYNCLIKAQSVFKEYGSIYYKSATDLRLAQVLYNRGKYDDSEYLLNDIISNIDTKENIRLSAIAKKAFLHIQTNPSYITSAISDYERLIADNKQEYMSDRDFWALSYSLNIVGRKQESTSLTKQLQTIDTSGTADYWMYMIEKSNGKLEEALKYLETATDKINRETAEALQQSLALYQRDYYESKAETYQYKERSKTLILFCVLAVSILIISSGLFFIFRYMHLKEEEKERYIRYADEISRQLEASKNEDYPVLKRKYMELYHSKFETIGYLYEQYALSSGKKNADKILSDKVKLILNEFKSSFDKNRAFEEIINRDMDNIVQKLRNEVTGLKETDYKIFSFTLVGFDVTTISHLLDMSINAVHIRRTRMRKHIEDLNPVHKAEFMETLSSRVIPTRTI